MDRKPRYNPYVTNHIREAILNPRHRQKIDSLTSSLEEIKKLLHNVQTKKDALELLILQQAGDVVTVEQHREQTGGDGEREQTQDEDFIQRLREQLNPTSTKKGSSFSVETIKIDAFNSVDGAAKRKILLNLSPDELQEAIRYAGLEAIHLGHEMSKHLVATTTNRINITSRPSEVPPDEVTMDVVVYSPSIPYYDRIKRGVNAAVNAYKLQMSDVVDDKITKLTTLQPSRWLEDVLRMVDSTGAPYVTQKILPCKELIDYCYVRHQQVGTEGTVYNYAPDLHYLLSQLAGMVSTVIYEPDKFMREWVGKEVASSTAEICDTQLLAHYAMACYSDRATWQRDYISYVQNEHKYVPGNTTNGDDYLRFQETVFRAVTDLDKMRTKKIVDVRKNNNFYGLNYARPVDLKIIDTSHTTNDTDSGVPSLFASQMMNFMINNKPAYVKEMRENMTRETDVPLPSIVRDTPIGLLLNFNKTATAEMKRATGGNTDVIVSGLPNEVREKLHSVKEIYLQLCIVAGVIHTIAEGLKSADMAKNVTNVKDDIYTMRAISVLFSSCSRAVNGDRVAYLPSLEVFSGALFFKVLTDDTDKLATNLAWDMSALNTPALLNKVPVTDAANAVPRLRNITNSARKTLIESVAVYMINSGRISASKMPTYVASLKGEYNRKSITPVDPVGKPRKAIDMIQGMRVQTGAKKNAGIKKTLHATLQQYLYEIGAAFSTFTNSDAKRPMSKLNPWYNKWFLAPPQKYTTQLTQPNRFNNNDASFNVPVGAINEPLLAMVYPVTYAEWTVDATKLREEEESTREKRPYMGLPVTILEQLISGQIPS